MRTEDPRPIRLKDYTPPAFRIEEVSLEIELDPKRTRVHSRLSMRRQGEGPLVLDGEKLKLHEVRIDGEKLGANRYSVDGEHLTIFEVPEGDFTLETVTTCAPVENTALTGLYLSSDIYCTQCEAEGFRRITYYLDRPDAMSVFRTRIVADEKKVPVLLSNGNPVASGKLDGGKHFVEWHDPFRKPAYLFALVAGDLAHVEDKFVTMSGREVTLRIFVEKGNEDRCDYAMGALKRAMKWDEEAFGREYDLDIFMIVAVSAFNMGAMENKGLNVFNDKYILALPDTATDADYAAIEAIIAHEYFHNWTGNRITCRDWFQLCLKEGLTVFRDQEFTSDMRSRPVKRISDVRLLRAHQFPEDGGPLAHPVRPDSYIEINNFYTATVYEKGAELCRMIHTMVGPKRFRKGMDLYFERHDGEAATVENFLDALSDGTKIDLTQFKRWYSQSGTPEVLASGRYDAARKTYTLKMSQVCPPTPGQPMKEPYHIPVAVGLVGADGRDMKLTLDGEEKAGATTRVLHLTEREGTWKFRDVAEKPVPSLLRGFTAPVKLNANLKERDWVFLMRHDSDSFNRWEAAQRYATGMLLSMVEAHAKGGTARKGTAFADMIRDLLTSKKADPDFVAQIIVLPSEQTLAQMIGHDVDVDAIHTAREELRASIAAQAKDELMAAYCRMKVEGPYRPEADHAGRRALRNACLSYLAVAPGGEGTTLAATQFREADNMTDSIAALSVLSNIAGPERTEALDAFYKRWQKNHLVIDKWLAIQAMSSLPGTLDEVKRLTQHPAFTMKNPNKVRALITSFASMNQLHFHDAKGAGYAFVADKVLELDKLNPQVAARLTGTFRSWRQFGPKRRKAMQKELKRIAATEGLSRDVYEIATKTLA
ncbi:aminopeptidase N [Parvibaculum sp.]|uniref:aminopeptidase N n=1 Tax=Parvibaculum sp. TaxID=2024848 RepID=UPI002732014A|nr:aminopeptidase N [Parvibaculum sp.]MDP1627553.1 aminopeptidase N [Parvibaculum sp.]MDP2148732.1 aminopeptidase N [Parvibaculum sp.]MDP3329960.1 aminopeptidase N [Parvibaculum sp.]